MNFEKKVTFIGFRKSVILQDFNKSNSVKAKLSISFWIFILHLIQLQHFSDILMHIYIIYILLVSTYQEFHFCWFCPRFRLVWNCYRGPNFGPFYIGTLTYTTIT